MKNVTWKRCGVAGLLLLGCTGLLPAAQAAITDADAVSLATAYGEALKSGDVALMQSIAGGELLEKRQAVWESAGYAEELRQTFESATITVVEIRKDGKSAAAVKLQVQFPGGLPMFRELTIAETGDSSLYRIIGESATSR